jgi:hypothetical protein
MNLSESRKVREGFFPVAGRPRLLGIAFFIDLGRAHVHAHPGGGVNRATGAGSRGPACLCITSVGANRLEASVQGPWTS